MNYKEIGKCYSEVNIKNKLKNDTRLGSTKLNTGYKHYIFLYSRLSTGIYITIIRKNNGIQWCGMSP